LLKALKVDFIAAQTAATFVAMTANFALNNVFTYYDMRLRGWRWVQGWMTFVLACSLGSAANVGIAAYLFEKHAGWPLAALAGITVGAVWNYAMATVYAWGSPKK